MGVWGVVGWVWGLSLEGRVGGVWMMSGEVSGVGGYRYGSGGCLGVPWGCLWGGLGVLSGGVWKVCGGCRWWSVVCLGVVRCVSSGSLVEVW